MRVCCVCVCARLRALRVCVYRQLDFLFPTVPSATSLYERRGERELPGGPRRLSDATAGSGREALLLANEDSLLSSLLEEDDDVRVCVVDVCVCVYELCVGRCTPVAVLCVQQCVPCILTLQRNHSPVFHGV